MGQVKFTKNGENNSAQIGEIKSIRFGENNIDIITMYCLNTLADHGYPIKLKDLIDK